MTTEDETPTEAAEREADAERQRAKDEELERGFEFLKTAVEAARPMVEQLGLPAPTYRPDTSAEAAEALQRDGIVRGTIEITPGPYSNMGGGGMTEEALKSAVDYILEQRDNPMLLQPEPRDPLPPALYDQLYKQPTIDPAAIRARVDKTTEGPWIQEGFYGTLVLPGTIGEPMGKESTTADLEFIGHARTDVPALLDVIDVLARLLLNPTYEIEFNEERVLTYRPEEVIEAMKTLGLDTEEKRADARVKLSWQGGGSLK